MTSSPSFADLKGNIFGHTISPPSLIIIASIVAKLWKGGGEGWILPPLLGPKRQKQKPGLDRIKEVIN